MKNFYTTNSYCDNNLCTIKIQTTVLMITTTI